MSHDDAAIYERAIKLGIEKMNCQDIKDEGVHCHFCEVLHPTDYQCDDAMLHKMILDTNKILNDLKKKIEFNFKNVHEFERVIDQGCSSLLERIEKLEGYMEMEDRVTCSSVLIRLTNLEDEMTRLASHTITRLGIIGKGLSENKTPHQCPVCYGEGNIYKRDMPSVHDKLFGWQIDQMGTAYKPCIACDSKGIVWG